MRSGRILQKIDRFMSASACLSNHDDYIVAAGIATCYPGSLDTNDILYVIGVIVVIVIVLKVLHVF
jgi:hypothetical protein